MCFAQPHTSIDKEGVERMPRGINNGERSGMSQAVMVVQHKGFEGVIGVELGGKTHIVTTLSPWIVIRRVTRSLPHVVSSGIPALRQYFGTFRAHRKLITILVGNTVGNRCTLGIWTALAVQWTRHGRLL